MVVIAAIIAVRIAHRTGMPTLLVFLGLGVLLGESGFGLQFDDAELAQQLGLIALAVILAEGGLTTNWRNIRRTVPTALVLATAGVFVSAVVLATAATVLLGLDWRMALLLGAIPASTDAAAVFSVLRRLPLPPRIAGMLEAESGFNDPPAVLLVIALSVAAEPLPNFGHLALQTILQLSVGAVLGLLIGLPATYALRRVALPASGLYPIAVLALALVAYSAAVLVNGSGFMAVYVAGLVLGNARLPHRSATRGFAEGAAWLAQIFLFVMLGLLASPSELPSVIIPALTAGLALLLVARPVSVAVCALLVRLARLDRLSWREQVFVSWAGLRGAVPIVLATIPWAAGMDGAKDLFNEVFVLVVVFTLIQGPVLPFLARRLGIAAPTEARDLNVESAPLEELNADLLQVSIPPGSRLHGVEIFELRLPANAQVTLIVRDGRSFVPSPTTRLQAGDQLLVVATAACRAEAERRLRAVSRRGKLATWYGEQGD